MSLIFSESWTCLPLFFLPPPMSPSAPSRHTNFARPSLSPLRGDRKLRSAPAENSARARSRLAGAREIDEFSFTSLETIQSHPLTFFFSPLSTLPLFSLQHTFHNSPPRRRRPPRCPPCRRRRRVSDGRELRAKKSRMNELFFFNFFVRLSAIVTQLIDSFFFFSSSAFFFLFFADPLSLNPATLFQKKKKKNTAPTLFPYTAPPPGDPTPGSARTRSSSPSASSAGPSRPPPLPLPLAGARSSARCSRRRARASQSSRRRRRSTRPSGSTWSPVSFMGVQLF